MNSFFNSFKVLLLFLCRLRVSLKDINMQMKSSLFYVYVMNKTHSPYFVIMDAPSDQSTLCVTRQCTLRHLVRSSVQSWPARWPIHFMNEFAQNFSICRVYTDDPTAVVTCVQHTRNPSVRRASVCFANASALTVTQIHSFTWSCPKEVVDGIYQYLPCYSTFNTQNVMELQLLKKPFTYI